MAAAALTWMATGRHVFTKYEAIEERTTPPGVDDPFAAAGFYDGNTAPQVVAPGEIGGIGAIGVSD